MIFAKGGSVSAELVFAEAEARRFLRQVKDLRERIEFEKDREQRGGGAWLGYISGCPESAAVRRASLDLTRALAKMRR